MRFYAQKILPANEYSLAGNVRKILSHVLCIVQPAELVRNAICVLNANYKRWETLARTSR